MAYGLPSRGQQDWDDELNNSMEALRADVQAALAAANSAQSNATDARSTAQAVSNVVLGTADAAVAGFVDDDDSDTTASVRARVAADVGDSDSDIGVALSATHVPKWKALTAYAAGAVVMAPDGVTISRGTSGTSRATFDATERATWSPLLSSALKINFVQDGDSIGFGSGATDASESQPLFYNLTGQIKSGLDDRFVFTNVAVPGATIATRRAAAAASVDTKLDTTPGVINVLSIHAGTNDLFVSSGSVSLATIEGNYQGYCDERRAAGWDYIFIHTVMPRTDASTPSNHETKRLDLNTWLRANYTTFADELADTGGDTIMGNVANTTGIYFADLVHPSNLGYRRMATYVRPLLARLGATGSHTHDQYQPRRKLFLPANRMMLKTGSASAVLTFNNFAPAWVMPDAESTLVCFSERLPDNWDFYRWELVWCPTAAVTAGADTVRFDLVFNKIIEGTSLAVGNAASGPRTSVGTAANTPKTVAAVNSVSVPSSKEIQIGIQRSGSDGTDTLTQSIHLLGIRLFRMDS